MVTGCVPIVEGGKILFVSSSRKADWILPKGGWEKDEGMEESAIRECFEEAGVLGILGPLLSEIEYETGKSKKRRKEFEELQRKAKVLRLAHADSPTSRRLSEQSEETTEENVQVDLVPNAQEPPTPQVSNEDFSKMLGHAKHSEETCSVASDGSLTHSHVRMSLFPLYVSEVKSSWPESGRFRKAVYIDEAIQMCDSRPELQAALIEVKERNLHLLPAQGPNCVVDR
jgi:diphosphoinositol-polyphosphate diphosphatase